MDNYTKSLGYGRRGAAVHRELASCYFELGNLQAAEKHIQEAEAASPHNKYIVDLRCTIAIRLGDIQSAERTLEILDRVDGSGFCDHRRSTLEQARGDSTLALEYARAAMSKLTNPPFEVIANLVNCEIEAGATNDALGTLMAMSKKYGNTRHDAQVGLRCKFEIRFGDIKNAEGLWNSLHEKGTLVHNGLRLSILRRKSQTGTLSEPEAEEFQILSDKQNQLEAERMTKMLGSLLPNSD